MKVGITSGCFDLPHPLHVEYLKKCKRQCDELIVLVDSDRLVTENKRVPILSEEDRRYMVENFKSVDEAVIFDSLEDFSEIVDLTIKEGLEVIIFKNSDNIYGNKTLEFPNTKLIIIPDVERFASTTSIIEHLKQLT